MKQVQAYNVLVRRKGKLSKVNVVPLDRPRALRKGIAATDLTPARTFVMQKTKGKVRSSGTKLPSLKKYRSPKGKSRLPTQAYVEKSKYAIDSPLERLGITAKGIKVLKLKGKKKVKKRKILF